MGDTIDHTAALRPNAEISVEPDITIGNTLLLLRLIRTDKVARTELRWVLSRRSLSLRYVISNVAENTAAAAGRIMDTDYAAETANLTKAQILQQAATSILAQANAQPQAVLSLLQ